MRARAHENCFTVTPGVTALEYAQRRSKLASKLPKNAIAIVVASDIKYRSGVVFYEFHQDSNFYYLTGTIVFPKK
jgi:intermediate cleaving peptidase 55